MHTLFENVLFNQDIDPDALTAAAHNGDWLSMENFEEATFVCMAGALGSSATLDFKIQEATDSSGTSVKDISGKAITQLTQAGGDGDQYVSVKVRATEMDQNNDFTHLRCVMTVGTATSDGAACSLRSQAHRAPVTNT